MIRVGVGASPKLYIEFHPSYTFDVCDSLLNLGPCGNVSMGEPAFLSEEFAATKRYVKML